jgi:hypothetical protein
VTRRFGKTFDYLIKQLLTIELERRNKRHSGHPHSLLTPEDVEGEIDIGKFLGLEAQLAPVKSGTQVKGGVAAGRTFSAWRR